MLYGGQDRDPLVIQRMLQGIQTRCWSHQRQKSLVRFRHRSVRNRSIRLLKSRKTRICACDECVDSCETSIYIYMHDDVCVCVGMRL